MSYNVIENVANTLDQIKAADHVFAFVAGDVYVVKSSSLARNDPPRKPDMVLAYFRSKESCEPKVEVIFMRS
jgi:hypothetical protein